MTLTIIGNHDITLDPTFYAEYGSYFHNQSPQSSKQCQELLDNSPSILWLKDESAIVDLVSPAGPRTTFKIYGSPLSPINGMWAFGYKPEEATQIWNKIPLDTDVIITHTPPKYHCDERKDRRSVGCGQLREALWRIRPKLHICGHVHESRGVDRILWDLEASNIKYKESSVEHWDDPGRGNNKISLLDLTQKSRKPLLNDGSVGDLDIPRLAIKSAQGTPPLVSRPDDFSENGSTSPSRSGTQLSKSNMTSTSSMLKTGDFAPATRGQGGIPLSLRCDLEALSGRMGRQETCVVNAAIMASSWPHGIGGKKYNKPIVVDIDLPVWGIDT